MRKKMTYRALPEHLQATADTVHRYMKIELGLSKILIEEEIDSQIEFRPTLSAKTPNHHFRCIEVSESIITLPIYYFILQCKKDHFPVLLYVAIPSGRECPDFRKHLKEARDYGVGVLEVNHQNGKCDVLNTPLSLSLTGLRRIDKKRFPKKYRDSLSKAEDTFLNGNPSKGCSEIYDVIEALTRKIACKTYQRRYWKKTISNPGQMKKKTGWVTVLKMLQDNLDRSISLADGKDLSDLSDVLLNRIIGVTHHRNESGHIPSNLKELIKRDQELRTRMENAVDLLADIIEATKCLRV